MKKNLFLLSAGVFLIILGIVLLVFVIVSSADEDTNVGNQEDNSLKNPVSVNETVRDNNIQETEITQNASEAENETEVEQSDEDVNEENNREVIAQTVQPEAASSENVAEEPDTSSAVTVEATEDKTEEQSQGNSSEEPESENIPDPEEQNGQAEQSAESQEQDTETPETTGSDTVVYFDGTTKVDTSLWNMILVNPDHYLPDDFTIDKMQVQGNYYLDSRVAPLAKQMIADAEKEGIKLQICSSIRDLDLQTRLFNNKINDLIDEGYSKEEARRVAATIVAVPGTSEHHTGLAMDIVTPSYQRLNSGYANTDAAKWLKANAAKYGFILRYPEDKTEITKIIFEPWHYRYVGIEYASFIMSEGICFEEFIELYGE